MSADFNDGAAGALPARLRMPRRFAVYRVGPSEFRVQSAAQNVSLGTLRYPDAFAALAERAREGFETAELLASLGDGERGEAEQVLVLLRDRGMLVDASAPPSGGAEDAPRYELQRLFFSHFEGGPAATPDGDRPADGREAQRRLTASTVTVLGLGQAGSAVARSLALAGVGRLRLGDDAPVRAEDAWTGAFYRDADAGRPRASSLCDGIARINGNVRAEPVSWSPRDSAGRVRDLAADSTLLVLCPDEFHPAGYHAVNEACLAAGTPWINHRVLGFEVTVGPMVVPGQTPCYRCFDLRLLGNLTDPDERRKLHGFLDESPLESGWLPVATGVEVLVTECLKRLSGFRPPQTLGHAVFLSPASGDVRRRPLLRIPRCPACGHGARDRPSIDPWAHA